MTKRPLWMIVVLLLGTAAALWGATKVSWGSDHQLESGFSALAVLALAGLLGMFAVGGWARRVLGAVIAVAGAFGCWQAVAAPGEWALFTGRGLALLGGVLCLAAGLLVVRHATALPTMGARYQLAGAERRSGDPDKDMWDDLSHGQDPTGDEP
ncbi:Trp biosynthesis-associated membrane protein [Actinophytocola sp.]|uniref:Trp biosynthesis-associated membrane protein n=1 Tax=Actinophytocola sp. TaxID=1872138 RepID=UPI00389A024C